MRIDPQIRYLGDFARLPVRWGRPVTQEEMAEAIGVSRVWYAMLESGTQLRTSPKVLERLAVVLMLVPAERARLIYRAMPELGPLEVGAQSALVLESFSVVRAATKRGLRRRRLKPLRRWLNSLRASSATPISSSTSGA
jgi:transcriptional regulator with XRE-family HTH domain